MKFFNAAKDYGFALVLDYGDVFIPGRVVRNSEGFDGPPVRGAKLRMMIHKPPYNSWAASLLISQSIEWVPAYVRTVPEDGVPAGFFEIESGRYRFMDARYTRNIWRDSMPAIRLGKRVIQQRFEIAVDQTDKGLRVRSIRFMRAPVAALKTAV